MRHVSEGRSGRSRRSRSSARNCDAAQWSRRSDRGGDASRGDGGSCCRRGLRYARHGGCHASRSGPLERAGLARVAGSRRTRRRTWTRVAVPAHSETLSATSTMLVRPRMQGWPISLPTGHPRCCSRAKPAAVKAGRGAELSASRADQPPSSSCDQMPVQTPQSAPLAHIRREMHAPGREPGALITRAQILERVRAEALALTLGLKSFCQIVRHAFRLQLQFVISEVI